jgi:diguanylate cyclase (GGDEF)-like protein
MLENSSYYDVEEINYGAHNGGTVEPEVSTEDQNATKFRYQKVGDSGSQIVTQKGNEFSIDGVPLEPQDLEAMLESVKNQTAMLSYYKPEVNDMAKYEKLMLTLQKSAELESGLEAIKGLVAAGHLHPEHYEQIRRHLYQDEMVPSIGNKRSYNQHLLNEGRGGVHVMFDANDFKSINDKLSHGHGDQAIVHIGTALRNAVDKTVGSEVAKIHRFGGDEFHIHVPTHEHVGPILRQLRTELDAVPPLGGTHKLSLSAGIGATPDAADKALNHGAKAQKNMAILAAGGKPGRKSNKIRAPHSLYVHDYTPGHEGPVVNQGDSAIVRASVPKPTTTG